MLPAGNQTTSTVVEIAIPFEIWTITDVSITSIPYPTTMSTVISTPSSSVFPPSSSSLVCQKTASEIPTLLHHDGPAPTVGACGVFDDQTVTQNQANRGLLVAAILPPFIVAGGMMILLALYVRYRKRQEEQKQLMKFVVGNIDQQTECGTWGRFR
ncbi:hypothetical protein BGX38DRAFT_1182295 [Terfezia claveryi]|nr:hypothetical protein BGX38DRAFT_1182295 [Terfezia claveryi]